MLTLIRAAGGIYDFRNYEEVYLCNGLSSELQILCISQKTSHEYILLTLFYTPLKKTFNTFKRFYADPA